MRCKTKDILGKVLILLSLTATVAIVSCSNEITKGATGSDEDEEEYIPNTGGDSNEDDVDDGSIKFSSAVWDYESTKTATKGTEIVEDFAINDVIGVYAFRLPEDGSVDITTTSPNFMHNEDIVKTSSSTWEYSPTKYWPSNPNDKLIFMGYAPYSEDNTMFYQGDGGYGFPILVHSTPEYMVDTEDLVLAGRRCTKAENGTDPVNLNYEHVLSRLRFEFRNDFNSTKYQMVVKEIQLINATTQSAFTYREMTDEEVAEAGEDCTGMLLTEYVSNEVMGTGTITADMETGALIGWEDYGSNGGYTNTDGEYCYYYTEKAYVDYNATDFTDITVDGQYLFVDPFVLAETGVWLKVKIEVYIDDSESLYIDRILSVTNEVVVEVTDLIEYSEVLDSEGNVTSSSGMQRGNSYVWRITYKPVEGAAIFVEAISFWDEVYNKHDL